MAKQLKNTNIVHTPDITIDPILSFPEDTVGVVRPDVIELGDEDDGLDVGIDEGGTDPTDTTATEPEPEENPDAPSVPGRLRVISQTSRITADGGTVVDVVFGVSPISGATNYELRLSVV